MNIGRGDIWKKRLGIVTLSSAVGESYKKILEKIFDEKSKYLVFPLIIIALMMKQYKNN